MPSDLPVVQHSLDRYMLEVGRIPVLERKEERALADRLKDDDPDLARNAARRLVAANLRFVVKVAFEYKNYNIRITDLIQEGNIGLMHAVSKFDPDRGYRLISYAVWWIKAYIQDYIIKNWSMVPISARRQALFGKRKLLPTGEEVVSVDDAVVETDESHYLIAAEASQPPSLHDARKELARAYRDFSLDVPIGSEGGQTTHLARLPSGAPNAEERLGRAQVQEEISRAIERVVGDLDERGRYILEHRLVSDEPMSLMDIGDHFGVTRERARQLESRVKEKLKKALAHLGQAEIAD